MTHKTEEDKDGLYGDAVREKILEFADRGEVVILMIWWVATPEDEREKWFTRIKFWGVFHQRTG